MQKEGRDPVDFRIGTFARNQLLIAVEETDRSCLAASAYLQQQPAGSGETGLEAWRVRKSSMICHKTVDG